MTEREEIKEKIQTADMVLVGAGEELRVNFEQVLEENSIYKRFHKEINAFGKAEQEYVKSSIYMREVNGDNKIVNEQIENYNSLYRQLKDKNYYIVSVCNDDVIYQSDFDKGRIVTPCGTRTLMQCEKGCTDEVIDTKENFEKLYQLLCEMNEKDEFDQKSIEAIIPRCEICRQVYNMNLAGCENYSEQGYLKEWERYTKWLQGTINRNVLLLELGVSFAYPTVIRWPFEKITTINQKATLVRVNELFPQIPKELAEKAISVADNSRHMIELLG